MKTRKGRGEKYKHVLSLMRTKGGTIATDDPDLVTLLGGPIGTDGSVLYRLSTYVSYIRKFTNVQVRAVRAAEKSSVPGQRRKVVRYELSTSIADGPTLQTFGETS